MHVLIFGGNRFIGKDVVRILADWDECDMIYLFNRTGRGHYNSKKVRCLVGDRNVSKDLKQIPWGYVDYVVDMCLYKTDKRSCSQEKLHICKQYSFSVRSSIKWV